MSQADLRQIGDFCESNIPLGEVSEIELTMQNRLLPYITGTVGLRIAPVEVESGKVRFIVSCWQRGVEARLTPVEFSRAKIWRERGLAVGMWCWAAVCAALAVRVIVGMFA